MNLAIELSQVDIYKEPNPDLAVTRSANTARIKG